MDYCELVDAHIDRSADITIAAQPVDADDATAMGIFRFDRDGQIVALRGEAERASGSTRSASSIPPGATFSGALGGQAVRRLDGHLRLLARRAARDARAATTRTTSAARSFPRRSARYRVNAYLFRGYWADVGTIDVVLRRQHHADARRARRSSFYDPRRPIYTHPRFLPGVAR